MSGQKLPISLDSDQDLFDPQLYGDKLDYSDARDLSDLVYVYLVPKGCLKAVKNALSERGDPSAEESPSGTFKPKELYDDSVSSKFIGEYTLLPVKVEIRSEDIDFVDEETFWFLKRHFSEIKEIKRVLYLCNSQVSVEMSPLFVNIYEVPASEPLVRLGSCLLSRFSPIDAVKQTIRQYFTMLVNDFSIFVENDSVTEELVDRIRGGKNEENELSKFSVFSSMVFNNSKLLLFELEEQKEIKRSTNCCLCERKTTLAQREICVCGRIYCDIQCQSEDLKHSCKPKMCPACSNFIKRLDMVSCSCGELYCDDTCLESDGERHASICPNRKSKPVVSNADDYYYETYPSASYPKSSYNYYGYSSSSCYRDDEKLLEKDNDGLIGLSNLGNTCYMNSALQSVLHTPLLKQHIDSIDPTKEANLNNPLGTKGELLSSFCSLFKKFWRCSSYRHSPSEFKHTVNKHLTFFEGYGQHDAQEFLSHMLDTLHEDTNRILKKPYIPNREESVENDNLETARTFWVEFLKRNYSWFTFNYYGQLKSIVKCKCGQGSVTFEPFQVISLPIPTLNTQTFQFFFLGADQVDPAVKLNFTAKSVYIFNDIEISRIVETYSKTLSKDPKRLVFSTLGSPSMNDVISSQEPLSKLFFASDLSYKLESFLIELTDVDMANLQNKEPRLFIMNTTYDVYENQDESKKDWLTSPELWSLHRAFPEHPTLTRIFYLSNESTVKDVYVAVMRKLMRTIEFAKFAGMEKVDKNKLDSAEAVLDLWLSTQPELFFFVKVGKTHLPISEASQELSKFGLPEKVRLNVFIRSKVLSSENLWSPRIFSKYVSETDKLLEFKGKDIDKVGKNITINQLLERFNVPEQLDEANYWFCSSCNTKVPAIKTLSIHRLPRILIIMLKRNKNSYDQPLISFPTDVIDMSNYVGDPEPMSAYNVRPEEAISPEDLEELKKKGLEVDFNAKEKKSSLYRLIAVSNHYGSNYFGHYTAFAKVSEKWHSFDDGQVSKMKQSDVVSRDSYILTLERIDPDEYHPPLASEEPNAPVVYNIESSSEDDTVQEIFPVQYGPMTREEGQALEGNEYGIIYGNGTAKGAADLEDFL